MIRRAPKTDETGLHAIDCECPRCDEGGFRPTELERAAARRSLLLMKAARERIARGLGLTEEHKPQRASLPAVEAPRPMSAEDLERMTEDLRQWRKNHGN
jgi:hypothetical protein